jgi:hypothetical protein
MSETQTFSYIKLEAAALVVYRQPSVYNRDDWLTHRVKPSDCAQIPFTECTPFTWFSEVFDDFAPHLERELRDSHIYMIRVR